VEALRAAFMKSMADADLKSEAERLKLDISPITGAEMAQVVNRIYDLPQSAIDAARAAIGSK
jgi:hypothetical protein